jgi:hypothetical protein
MKMDNPSILFIEKLFELYKKIMFERLKSI